MRELPKVYFERLLESAPDIVIAVDNSGDVIFYNDGAEQTLGYNAEEVLGKTVLNIYPSREEARRVMAALRSEADGGKGRVKNFETALVNKGKEEVPVAISGSIIYDGRGHERGSMGFAKDLSELRRHEQMHTLAEVAVGLAHEINTPLEVAVNQAAMLERYLKRQATEEDYPIEHDRVDAINRALRRIQSIVERVGEMADSGRYGTTEYLPGRLMTDLGLESEPMVINGDAVRNNLTGKTIMVVDDDESVCGSMADLLEAEGCQVLRANSGLTALRRLEHSKVDMVISDVVMPDMDGYDLFTELRSRETGIPVVLMTAYYYDKDHVIKRSRAGGLTDVIFKKPIDPGRLLQLIDARVGN